MTTDYRELNVALEHMLLPAGDEEAAAEQNAEFDLRLTLNETVVREAGYADFLAALRASGHAPA
jgi:hypothetical protein